MCKTVKKAVIGAGLGVATLGLLFGTSAKYHARTAVDEVRSLLARPRPLSRTAQQAVGYRETIEHLHGQHTREATIELVQRHTRQFAKRQGTWFRSLSECRFIAVAEPLDAAAVAEEIAQAGQAAV